MRVIIPAAGIGKRLRPHTHTVPKVLLRLAGKPILGHIVDLVIDFKPSEIIFVVGYKADLVKKYLEENYSSYNLKFVYQKERKGLGHAIYSTGNANEETLIILGDTIFRADLKKVIKEKINSIGVYQVEDPRRFGVVELDDSNNIKRLIEKPENPPTNLAVTGVYYIKDYNVLYDSLKFIIENNIKTTGEFQLTDALQKMVKDNYLISIFKIDKWLDCGKAETMLSTQKILLDEKSNSYIKNNNLIIPPVWISKNAKINNSIIGPYVDIASETIVSGSIISNSIIGKEVKIDSSILKNSILGDNTVFKNNPLELNIGESSEVLIK